VKTGSATVPVASSRRPADWRWSQNGLFFIEPYPGTNAFGETPKAAGGTPALPNPSAGMELE
jgi:hypothetical protein